jgi:pyridoxine kinase
VEVDAINSVQFSNHTGYPQGVRGDRLDGVQLSALVEGLEVNGLIAGGQYSHLLTGYIGSLSFLQAVAHVAATLRAAGPVTYLCDPVLGDGGKLYVPPELVGAYRDEAREQRPCGCMPSARKPGISLLTPFSLLQIVPLAHIVTPNQFEAELLTGRPVQSVAEALEACELLHGLGPHTVIITSMEVGSDAGHLNLVGSTRLTQEAGCPQRFLLRLPKLERPSYFTGAGDLTAALILARTAEGPHRLAEAVELAVASVQAVLRRTADAATAAGAPTGPAAVELRLIQSAAEIVRPEVLHRVEPLP